MNNKKLKPNITERINFATLTHNTIKQEISKADTKASISLSIMSLLFSISVTIILLSDLLGKITVMDRDTFVCSYYFIIGAYCVFTMSGTFSSISVYRARIKHPKVDGKKCDNYMFFRSIKSINKPKEFHTILMNLTEEQILKQIAYQVHELSKIATKKMNRVNVTIYILVVSTALAFASLILSSYILLMY